MNLKDFLGSQLSELTEADTIIRMARESERPEMAYDAGGEAIGFICGSCGNVVEQVVFFPFTRSWSCDECTFGDEYEEILEDGELIPINDLFEEGEEDDEDDDED